MYFNKKAVSLCILMATTSLFVGCGNRNIDFSESNEKIESELKEDNKIEISINAFGDLLIHNSVYDSAKTKEGYDFTAQFDDIREKVTNSDYTIGNLEIPIGKSDFSNYPSFRAPWEIAKAMKNVLDVELLTTASNHTLDKGFNGLKTTLDCLDEIGINHVGSYRTEEEADKILIEDIKGVKVAMLAYTYGTNGYPIPKSNPKAVNLINKEKIKEDAEKAKELGADFIIVNLHDGQEYELNANKNQKDLAEYIFSQTEANLIIGHHPHVVQEIEEMTVMKDGKEKKGVVAYSLGNFTSGQNKQYRDTGCIAKFNIVVDKNNPENTEVKSVEYTPVFVDRNPTSTGKNHRVVDINKAISDYENGTDKLISKEEYDKLIYYRDYYRKKLIKDDFIKEL